MEMNSRPIQQAEKDFFLMPLTGKIKDKPPSLNVTFRIVPVVAIVTKFDTFLQDMQQKLEEKAEEEDEEVDDDELERRDIYIYSAFTLSWCLCYVIQYSLYLPMYNDRTSILGYYGELCREQLKLYM